MGTNSVIPTVCFNECANCFIPTFADITLAINELLWFPKYTLADIVEHAYKWENR
jgi:nucleoside-diphosphate-sugar epimerase